MTEQVCSIVNCSNQRIPRGKYCELHRSSKKLCVEPGCKKNAQGKSNKCINHEGSILEKNRIIFQTLFIQRGTEKYGNRYDYSKIQYTDNKTAVIIYCTIHDINFNQRPDNHINAGFGCEQCFLEDQRIKQQTIFITKSLLAHDSKYNYSKVIYVDQLHPVIIICDVHGEFMQRPHNHLHNKHGCKKCAPNRPLTNEIIYELGTIIHKGKYDYSKVDYNTGEKIIIICHIMEEDGSIHGEFKQNVGDHLNKEAGCPHPTCVGKFMFMDDHLFKKRALKVHGEMYGYDKVIYIDTDTNVLIECSTHGEFLQRPHNHLRGQKCPLCSLSFHSSKPEKEWLTALEDKLCIIIKGSHHESEGQFKVPSTRFKTDGYCSLYNMILEFHGCWYHGCPTCFPNQSDINVRTKTSYKELLDKTNKRKQKFTELGYIVVEIWECEWTRIKKHNSLLDEHVSYIKNQLI